MFNEKNGGGEEKQNSLLLKKEESQKTEGVEKKDKKDETPVETTVAMTKEERSNEGGSGEDGFIKEEGGTLEELDKKNKLKERIKNLTSVVIILVGVTAGSFFVDLAQFLSGKGYSPKALKEAEVFVAGEKTWVAYNDPVLETKVITADEDEYKSCPNCDPTEVLMWLKRFMPTISAKKVSTNSQEGKELIEKMGIKTIPAFIFPGEIEETDFYLKEAKPFFQEKDGKFLLNTVGLGVPVGKYLEIPQISEEDVVKGNKEGKVKIIVFSDFQCPYCKKFFETVTTLIDNYKDQVALVYKDMPLDFHPQSNNSAMAVHCAADQGKFWEMAKLLYDKQEEWGETEGTTIFEKYTLQLGLNQSKFKECLESQKFKEKIEKDTQLAQDFGISGTPAAFINDEFISGAVSEEQLKQVIEKELNK